MDIFSAYIPQDRREGLRRGLRLPTRSEGAALFADISGFTALTEALVGTLGPQRGAEELSRQLDLIYEPLIAEVERYGGSVISFSGDAITCWFDGSRLGGRAHTATCAVACAMAMQATMAQFSQLRLAGGQTVSLAIKVAVASGPAQRFIVGAPEIQQIDVLAGATLDRLAAAEHEAEKGEVVIDAQASADLSDQAEILELRSSRDGGGRVAVVGGLRSLPEPQPWPAEEAPLDEAVGRPWLHAPVYDRLASGLSEFLTEIRPAVALFLRFAGIQYDSDPQAGERLDAFTRWVQSVCLHYGGYLLQLTIGDKGSYLYVAFGALRSYGDDSSRAVRAALELREVPPALDFIQAIQIGISQGRMRAGTYGGTLRRTYGVLGDEVNTAARLMQSALPGQVLVIGGAQRALAESFHWQTLPPLRMKGKAQPAIVYAVTDSRTPPPIRFQEPSYALPMVGREAELAAVEALLRTAAAGRGQIVGITGEAGIGKSRLVAEVIRLATRARFVGYGGECQSFSVRTAYTVWRPILQAFFGLDPLTSAASRAQALAEMAAALGPQVAAQLPLLATPLDLPIPETPATQTLDPRGRKALLARLLIEFLRSRAAAAPLLLVIEDAQWIDSLSADLLEAIGRAIADLPMLLLVAYRPPDPEEQRAIRVSGLGQFTELRLDDFTPEQAAQLIKLKLDELFGFASVPADLVAHIQSRAQGNPFYIEELLNYIRDRAIDPRDPAQLAALELPGSLASLILSRIDTLSENQQATLKIASIVGRRFAVDWLWGIYPELGEADRVVQDLERLDRLGLTPLDAPEPELAYLFRHILTQEVSYESLPYATRARLHERLARWLEAATSDRPAPPIDLLAFHYSRSENREKELEYTAAAGELASRNGAYVDAYNYLHRAISLLATMPARPGAVEQELSLQLTLGPVCIARFGQASDEAKLHYDRARELCGQLAQTPLLARAVFGLWAFYLFRGEMRPAYELALQCHALAQAAPQGDLILPGNMAMANTLFWMGEFERSLSHLNEVVAHYDPAQHHNYIVRFAQNPRITSMTCGMFALLITGNPDQSLASGLETLELAHGLNHDFSVVLAMHSIAVIYQQRGEVAEARRQAEIFGRLAAQRGIQFYATLSTILLGWVIGQEGDLAAGIARMREGLASMSALGGTLLHSYYVTLLAEALLRSDDPTPVPGLLDPEIVSVLEHGRHCFLAELYRLRGELQLHAAQPDAAEAARWFGEAIVTAREQRARAFELRASMGLARLYQQQGRRDAALALLAPLYAQFSEGLATHDLATAARLLADLQASR